MKHEPTALTMAGIYGLLQLELEDLNTEDLKGELSTTIGALDKIGEMNRSIREDLDNITDSIIEVGIEDGYREGDPEVIHKQFTDIYRIALDLAGKAVRLAAVTRRGIIDSVDLGRIDRCEGGRNGKDTD